MNNDRLKFRAWCEVPLDDDGKKMIYGIYLYGINVFDGGKEIGFDDNILTDNIALSDNLPATVRGKIISHFSIDCVNLDSYYRYKKFKCIEQCTGLKDKHGRLIYEGDIVRVYYDKCVVNWIGWEGHFLITSACTDPLSLEDDLSYQFGEVSESEIEVIGNIHENKNLLEENK